MRRKLGVRAADAIEKPLLREYQLAAEMAQIIIEDDAKLSSEIILYGLRQQREEIWQACMAVIARSLRLGDWQWVELLRRSSSARYRRAFEELVTRTDTPMPEPRNDEPRALAEFRLLKDIANALPGSSARSARRELESSRPSRRTRLFGRALAEVRCGDLSSVLAKAFRLSSEAFEISMSAVSGHLRAPEVAALIEAYAEMNLREWLEGSGWAYEAKATAVGAAILRCISAKQIGRVRMLFKRIHLTRSARQIALAILALGDVNDAWTVLRRIGRADSEVPFQNHAQLMDVMIRNLEARPRSLSPELISLTSKAEFWDYIVPERRALAEEKNLLPLRSVSNRRLFVRLASSAIIGSTRSRDSKILVRLASHSYQLVARAASLRLARLKGAEALRLLSGRIEDSIQGGKSGDFAQAVRAAEMRIYGVAFR